MAQPVVAGATPTVTPTRPGHRRWPSFTPARALWIALWTLATVGVVAIVCYSLATTGSHLAYIGTGVLTAFAAGMSGGFFGFLLGIPRVVSSGALRAVTDRDGADPSAPGPQFSPSTNLAEVSDWLTKLLLGAGLVSLTKLGEPAGRLFRTIGAGLASGVDGAAVVVAGAIVITYVALGFMGTYIATSVWYARMLEGTGG